MSFSVFKTSLFEISINLGEGGGELGEEPKGPVLLSVAH